MPDPAKLGFRGAVDLLAACSTTFGFTRTFWPVIEPGRAFVPGWHVGNICEHLDWVGNGGCQNLIINIPPRCMKSLLVCVFWFCKQWLTDPASRWMYSSFAQDLVQRDSQRCRDVMRHPLYQHLSPVRVKNDQDTQLRFTNQFQGFRYAVTVAGQGMGEGADYIVCLPYNTHVETDAGLLPIGRIVEEKLPVRMLAFDHATGRPAYRPIEEYESNPGKPAVTIRFSDGRELTATDEHPVYVRGRGYVPAADLRPGDEVITRDPEPDLSGVREAILPPAVARCPVQNGRVLFASVPRHRSDGFGEQAVRRRPGRSGVPHLQKDVHRSQVDSETRPAGRVVLFAAVPRCHPARRAERPICDRHAAVRLLHGTYHPPAVSRRAGVLRPAVCESVSRAGDARVGEPAVRSRGFGVALPGRIPAGAPADPRPGREQVPELRGDGNRERIGPAGPSRQLRQGRQPAGKPDNRLQVVSRPDARQARESAAVGTAVVVSVTRAATPDRVYNVRVAVDHNYFAGGVLVHNCDDPINPRRARSAVERAKVIHWWTSTMQMRANDPATCRKVIIMQRLHERDLTGYLIAEQTGWEHLVLPMRYEPRRFFLPGSAVPSGPIKGGDGAAEVGPDPAPAPDPVIDWSDPASIADAAARLRQRVAEQVAPARPRDAIVPTALQRRRPELMDGSEKSGRAQEGDLLWPRRLPEAVVAKAETDLGVDAPGQYQQRPSAEAGEIFLGEFFRRYTSLWTTDDHGNQVLAGVRLTGPGPDQVRDFAAESLVWFQTIDTALTESKRSAFTAVGTFCATPQYDLLVWDMFRAKMAVPYQFPAIEELRIGPCVWNRKLRQVQPVGSWPARMLFQAIENKASGIGLIQQAAAEGKPFHPLKVDGDKVQRAGPVAVMYRNGKVYHPAASRPWVVQMEDELLTFPNGTYKDQADVIAYAGYLVTHDKLIRSNCANRVMADVPDLDAEGITADENTVHVPTPFGSVAVQFPADDDGIFDLFRGRQR